ncbi:hypothetical protein B0A55_09267, partial [Friedmanniomyces simplex]
MVPPAFSVQSGWTLDDVSQVTVTRGPTTFVVSVRFSNVERTPWGRDYLQRIGRLPSDHIDNADNATGEQSPDGSEMLLSRCSPLMLKLAPTLSIQGLPVEVLCSSPTYRLELLSTGEVEDDGVQIAGTENLTSEANRFSRLVGIVTTGEFGEQVAGILLEFIVTGPGGGDCLRRAVQARTEMHEKWKAQVGETVNELHAHQLVWGDVNAGNVVIDESSNAWVIDFGGLNNPEFVDDELAETEEGDWQGVHRLFDEWLPSPT